MDEHKYGLQVLVILLEHSFNVESNGAEIYMQNFGAETIIF